MRMKLFFALTALLAAAAPIWAHHAFAAEFDAKKPVHLEGVVSKVELINPHAWIHVDVTNDKGEIEGQRRHKFGPADTTGPVRFRVRLNWKRGHPARTSVATFTRGQDARAPIVMA